MFLDNLIGSIKFEEQHLVEYVKNLSEGIEFVEMVSHDEMDATIASN